MSEEHHGLPGEMYPMSIDQQDECPKAFYCLPESCGDCPHDQQGKPLTTDMAFEIGYEKGERAATERIVKWLRSDRWIGFRSTCMSLAYAIERCEHE